MEVPVFEGRLTDQLEEQFDEFDAAGERALELSEKITGKTRYYREGDAKRSRGERPHIHVITVEKSNR